MNYEQDRDLAALTEIRRLDGVFGDSDINPKCIIHFGNYMSDFGFNYASSLIEKKDREISRLEQVIQNEYEKGFKDGHKCCEKQVQDKDERISVLENEAISDEKRWTYWRRRSAEMTEAWREKRDHILALEKQIEILDREYDNAMEAISGWNKQHELDQEEIACLKSVLSEWDQDKSCYLQWIRANDLASFRNNHGTKGERE